VRLPRDLSGAALAKALAHVGYVITRQTGSHIRLTTHEPGKHHITIPRHDQLRVGTVAAIVKDVGEHAHVPREDLLRLLFG